MNGVANVATQNGIDQKIVFTVPDMDDHRTNVEYFIASIEESKQKALKSISRVRDYESQVYHDLRELRNYTRHFKLRGNKVKGFSKYKKVLDNPAKYPAAVFTKPELEKIQIKIARVKVLEETRDKREAERDAERRQKSIEMAELWRKDQIIPTPIPYFHWQAYHPLALRVKDDRVETSLGAQITVPTALKLWEHIKAKLNVSGLKLYNYTADSYDGQTLVVGCHKIPVSEIERIAGILGVK